MRRISLSPAMPGTIIGGNARCCILVIGCILCLLLCVHSSVGQQKFCGKTLTDAMDFLCLNGYNDKITSSRTKKRSASGMHMELNADRANYPLSSSLASSSSSSTSDLLYPVYNDAGLNPFWLNIYANALAKTRRRREGGVYDECCRKSCSYSELAAYCRPL